MKNINKYLYIMYEVIYKSDMVLINAFFYSFWMKRNEYNKYIHQTLKEFNKKINFNNNN